MNQINNENIKPNELTVEKLFELLSRIESVRNQNARKILEANPYTGQIEVGKRPPEIWKTFHKFFGPDYFHEVIEEEYGISPKTDSQMANQISKFFDNQVQKFKSQ